MKVNTKKKKNRCMKSALYYIVPFLFCLITLDSTAQFYEEKDRKESQKPLVKGGNENTGILSIGGGIGINYGGLGGSISYLLTERAGVFGSIGYASIGVGYNLGATYNILKEKRVMPYACAMYGFNSAIIVRDLTTNGSFGTSSSSEYDKIYYGFSLGGGIKLHSRRKPENYWNFSLFFPIHSDEYRRDLNKLKSNPRITASDPAPLTIGIGYHFSIN